MTYEGEKKKNPTNLALYEIHIVSSDPHYFLRGADQGEAVWAVRVRPFRGVQGRAGAGLHRSDGSPYWYGS